MLLHLWAASVERAPWVSDELARDHLGWAGVPLQQMENRGGFYGSLGAATAELVGLIRATTVSPV